MEPGYPNGTRFIIEAVDPPDLDRGDLIYFQGFRPETFYVKRLIGLPGEVVAIISGTIYIDGSIMKESYEIIPDSSQNGEWSLSENEYFVLGDNRPNSADSHLWGPINVSVIIGRAIHTD